MALKAFVIVLLRNDVGDAISLATMALDACTCASLIANVINDGRALMKKKTVYVIAHASAVRKILRVDMYVVDVININAHAIIMRVPYVMPLCGWSPKNVT